MTEAVVKQVKLKKMNSAKQRYRFVLVHNFKQTSLISHKTILNHLKSAFTFNCNLFNHLETSL